jgi:hypothetical protein
LAVNAHKTLNYRGGELKGKILKINACARNVVAVFCLIIMPFTYETKAAEIQVTSQPPLPVANLLKNPSFDILDGNFPSNWPIRNEDISKYVHIIYHSKNGHSGGFVRFEVGNAAIPAYLTQSVTVEPNTLYKYGGWIRYRFGNGLMHLSSVVTDRNRVDKSFDNRRYIYSWAQTPLVPNFVPEEWTDSPPFDKWCYIETDCKTLPGQQTLTFNLGSYFSRSSIDFDDVFLIPAITTLNLNVSGGRLKRISVNDENGQVHWDSGTLSKNLANYIQSIPNLPSTSRYLITCELANGSKIQKWYPESKK